MCESLFVCLLDSVFVCVWISTVFAVASGGMIDDLVDTWSSAPPVLASRCRTTPSFCTRPGLHVLPSVTRSQVHRPRTADRFWPSAKPHLNDHRYATRLPPLRRGDTDPVASPSFYVCLRGSGRTSQERSFACSHSRTTALPPSLPVPEARWPICCRKQTV